tara:strand:- start:3713 stop:4288 length:576 start_codon:yes stop_codon:yes gene_type:complete
MTVKYDRNIFTYAEANRVLQPHYVVKPELYPDVLKQIAIWYFEGTINDESFVLMLSQAYTVAHLAKKHDGKIFIEVDAKKPLSLSKFATADDNGTTIVKIPQDLPVFSHATRWDFINKQGNLEIWNLAVVWQKPACPDYTPDFSCLKMPDDWLLNKYDAKVWWDKPTDEMPIPDLHIMTQVSQGGDQTTLH